ncbi:hypothetical protein B4U80_11305 [Leptotrombidium deliense]|uniref:Uncharacterized protein n=1 Tax=Leptotrombidium deliense TaxID=299467 RepID=A0A443SSB4_9ACAR|nr:hypothetical protein B4U80_11305 [Leptotrombidium deliense]
MHLRVILVLVAVLVTLPTLLAAIEGNQWPKSDRKKSAETSNRVNSIQYQDWGDLDWSEEDLLQHPIDDYPRKKNRGLGHMCSFSEDCSSGCCLLNRETKIRSCQPRAIKGERCSAFQIKGDLFVDACPCEAGIDSCANNAYKVPTVAKISLIVFH